MCVNVTTMIRCLLPGGTATNTGVLGPETVRSALLLTVLVALSWPETAAIAIALRTAGGSGPRLADGLFVGGRDDFGWEVQPGRTH